MVVATLERILKIDLHPIMLVQSYGVVFSVSGVSLLDDRVSSYVLLDDR